MLVYSLLCYCLYFNGYFSGGCGLAGTRNVTILDVIGPKDDGDGGNNWSYMTCKAPVKSSPPTNQHPVFYRPDALPVVTVMILKVVDGFRYRLCCDWLKSLTEVIKITFYHWYLMKLTRSSADADKPARRVYRSVKVTNLAPFHMLGIVSYCAIVTLSLRCAVFTIFDFKKCRDLEIGVRGHSRSLKVAPFDRFCMVSY